MPITHPSLPALRWPALRGLARQMVLAVATLCLVLGVSTRIAVAQTPLQLVIPGSGGFTPLPIGIPTFAGDGALAGEVSKIVTSDLRLSGYFAPIDPASHPDKVLGADRPPNAPAWAALRAQAVIGASVSRQGGELVAQMRLWDATSGQQLDGQQFTVSGDTPRRLAHLIADAVYSKLTGFGPMFDSRVVFVDETGPKERRVKRLAIMDWDGANLRYLTRGGELVLTPRFSPSQQQLAYMSLGEGDPRVFLLNVATGARELVGQFNSMTFAPRFSPDGGTLLFSLQKEGDANIFAMSMGSKAVRQLTSGASIDTGPSFSPDGSQIVFESDRGGSQQLYVMGAGGGGANRISFGNGRYSTPVWSPDKDNPLIAFTKQEGGQFKIGVMRPDGKGERILAEGYHNEGPTWSPNGRYVMFFSATGGAGGGPSIFMADVTGQVKMRVPTPGFASDPAWSPLLSRGP